MKTREQIYGREAAGLLRDITMYHVLTAEQLVRLHPDHDTPKGREKIAGLLAWLVKQGRVWHDEGSPYYCDSEEGPGGMDRGLFSAVWVLTDFIDQTDYHSTGDFPAKVIFFANGEVYEIVHAAPGKETLLSQMLANAGEQPSRCLVLVDDPAQVEELQIPNASGYCTVSPEGEVHYYQKE